jgi:hypothetical protein
MLKIQIIYSLLKQYLLPGRISYWYNINDGQLRNSGVEFDINGSFLKAKTSDDLKLSVRCQRRVFKK